ncbi:MAG: malonate decarboxylase subunit epsilon [Burkholderiales bacterium]|nr:malonate decarboxylase subunit epsilon [Burkholderiales bacterium]
MSLALLFPGQGTQHPEMLRWLADEPAAAPTLAQLAGMLGADWRARLADPAWAGANETAQCLLTGLGVAAWQCLAPELPAPAIVAGYSVGELPAFCAAGVFDARTALSLARRRAQAMQASVAGLDTGLLAVQGLGPAALQALAARHGLALAIRLGPDRAVLGGPAEALTAAQPGLEAAGGHCTRLAVAIASHTPWMAAAAEAFARHLAERPFAAPRCAVVTDFGGTVRRRPDELKQALAAQIAHPVHWDRCCDVIAEHRVRCVLEMGPGSTLARLWHEREPAVPARSIDEFRSAAAVLRWVRGALAA